MVSSFLSLVSEEIRIDPSIQRRARELEQASIQPFDALHAACAEASGAEYLITTDRSLERNLHRVKNLTTEAINPITFVQRREEA